MNYATLTICKVLLELPFPFVLSSPGLRLIMIIWLVEIVIVSLSITSAFYRQLVILHEKTTKLEESSIKAQYTALQNQLNPHFLFNSLNTLISEIEYNPENAVVFYTKAIRCLPLYPKKSGTRTCHFTWWTGISGFIYLSASSASGKMHSTGKQNDPHVIEQENPFINPTVTYRKRDKT